MRGIEEALAEIEASYNRRQYHDDDPEERLREAALSLRTNVDGSETLCLLLEKAADGYVPDGKETIRALDSALADYVNAFANVSSALATEKAERFVDAALRRAEDVDAADAFDGGDDPWEIGRVLDAEKVARWFELVATSSVEEALDAESKVQKGRRSIVGYLAVEAVRKRIADITEE